MATATGDRPVERLETVPGMGAAFARALVPSRARRAQIPASGVSVEGLSQDGDRLADYARVCGFTLRDEVPPTWLHVLTFPLHVHLLGSAQSSVRLAGAIHVSNTMTLHRPVLAHERLELTVHADHVRPHRRGALVDLIGQVHVEDERVWDGVSTYLAQGMTAAGEAQEPTREPWSGAVPHGLWRLPADLGRQYRRVSQDPNPIHASRVAAKAFGFERPLIHGMWTHARSLAALEGRLPRTYRAHVDFVRPILLPSTVGFASRSTSDGVEADVTSRDGAKAHLRMRVQEIE